MKRELGQFYTVGNCFDLTPVRRWLDRLPRGVYLEPFAGAGAIPRLVGHTDWHQFDIAPRNASVMRRDTLLDFPTGYQVCITNPPYLAANSAKRQGLAFTGPFDNLYKQALGLMLAHCPFVGAIVPDSFMASGLFTERLTTIVSLPFRMFDDTDVPVCLALFDPEPTTDFDIWRGNDRLTSHLDLQQYQLPFVKSARWRVGDPDGAIGCFGVDNQHTRIRFVPGNEIESKVDQSNRAITRISGPAVDFDATNHFLERWRADTHDLLLTSYRGVRADGLFRRRLDWRTAVRLLSATPVCPKGQFRAIRA